MQCSKCKTDNPEGAKFCIECGHNLSLPSKKVPKIYSVDEKIKKLQKYLPKGLTEIILSQKEKIEGERKQVTVMFCDMVGFTPLVERLGADESYNVMDKIYEILIRQVHEYEGTVNQMTGDGIMALYGAPIAVEDAPQRALRSALSIHQEIINFNEFNDITPPIKMRIGIHTGPVVVGTLGNDLRVEFKAVGDTVNLASRVERLASPGSIYVTEDTYKLTEPLFRFEFYGKRKIIGKTKTISVYKLLSVKNDIYRPRLGDERMIYSEMLGRDQELDKLELQVIKLKNDEGSVVNIIGEPGIGKSRLIAELKQRDVMKRVMLIEGRAISMGKNLSFHPIIDIIKQWARIKVDDKESTAFSKLETATRGVHPEGASEIIPFVATLMGIKLRGKYAERIKGIDGEALEKLIFKNVRDLLINAAALNPLVLIMEDFHWADLSSIELLKFLFRLAKKHRILFINVFRPGYSETDDQIVKTLKDNLSVYYVEIVLKPLDKLSSITLINNMLKIISLPHKVSDQIVKRSDGNPFFIEEVVRSFIDEGVVVLRDNTFEVTDKINMVIVPQTISEVLTARMDRLEENTRNVVKIASVIGRYFFYRILKEVATDSVEDIDDRLSYLKEIQFIRERKRMEEIEYLFKHALAQEAAYESILLQKRKTLHLKAANSIERVFTHRLNDFYGILSYHYCKGEDLEKAEKYILKAGGEALKASASSEALHYYQMALQIYVQKSSVAVDPIKVSEMQENIAVAYLNKGHFVEAVDYFDRSIISRGGKVQKNKILISAKLAINLLFIIRYLYLPQLRKKTPTDLDDQDMNRKFKKAIAKLTIDTQRCFIDNIDILRQAFKFDVSNSQSYFNYLSGSSCLFSMTGLSFNISRKILDYLKKSINKHDDKISIYAYKAAEIIHNCLSGNWHEDLEDNLIEDALKAGDMAPASVILLYLGYIKIEMGDYENCIRIFKKLKSIGDEYNYEHANLDFLDLNSRLLIKKRQYYKAITFLTQGISLSYRLSWDARTIQLLGLKLRILVMQNQLDSAEKIINEAENLIHKVGKYSIFSNFYSDYLMSKFFHNLTSLEKAIDTNNNQHIESYRKTTLKSAKEAINNSSKKVAADRTEAYKLMGRYYWLIGKYEKAVKWWDKSIKEGERIGAKLELSKTYFEIGKKLLEKTSDHKELNGIKAEEFLEKARSMFEEMDLHRDLEQLE